MLDSVSMERLALVHPVLSARVQNLASQLDFPLRITQGIRTVAEQDALYEQGRTTPGNIVTNAKGTESNHVMGVAVDVVPMDLPDGDQEPDWNPAHESWQRIVALAPACGLRNGISWKDEPHLELAEVPKVPSGEMQSVYLQAGVEAVWQELNIV
jgi:peptidoglycan L-alanyl-D-glutamate endopeptidase CwlK